MRTVLALFPLLLLCSCTISAPRRVRIAVCQIEVVESDLEGNFTRIEEALTEAAAQEAQLACFPEACLLGWVNPAAHDLAPPIPGAWTDRLADLARKHGLMIAIGLTEKDGEDLYNSAVLLGRNGEVLLRHRKVNLIENMMPVPYTPGDLEQNDVVGTALGRIGMLICADTFVLEHLTGMGERAPDLLVIPYGWAADPAWWPGHGYNLMNVVTNAAKHAGCPVVGVDPVGSIDQGPWTGKTYGGLSVISDRHGEWVVILADRRPEVRVVEVPVGR